MSLSSPRAHQRRPQQQQQQQSMLASPLVALGLLVTVFSLLMLYTHTNHMDSLYDYKQQKFRFESTTYHSSQKTHFHKKIHRNKDGEEVVEIVQDKIQQARDKEAAIRRKKQEEETDEDTDGSDADVEQESEPKETKKKDKMLRTNMNKNDKESTWLAPRLTKESTVILVLSARSHIELRQVIRETWGNGHDNVYFVIGQYCPVNQSRRKNELTCEDMPLPPKDDAHSQKQHDEWYEKRMKLESQVLREEQEHYRDMLWTPSPESYRGLPHKMKEGYQWIVTNLPNTRWIVKADDDTIVRVKSLSTYLEKTLQYTKPTVIGKIEHEGIVHKEGRWREDKYPHEKYPPFPLGSCGHVVSRPVAEYIAKHKDSLVEYQGEDTSIGIWMDESPLKVDWLHSESFENNMMCENPNSFVIGHDLSVERIRECYAIGDEVQPMAVTQF